MTENPSTVRLSQAGILLRLHHGPDNGLLRYRDVTLLRIPVTLSSVVFDLVRVKWLRLTEPHGQGWCGEL
jgi:hypothetical protein